MLKFLDCLVCLVYFVPLVLICQFRNVQPLFLLVQSFFHTLDFVNVPSFVDFPFSWTNLFTDVYNNIAGISLF